MEEIIDKEVTNINEGQLEQVQLGSQELNEFQENSDNGESNQDELVKSENDGNQNNSTPNNVLGKDTENETTKLAAEENSSNKINADT